MNFSMQSTPAGLAALGAFTVAGWLAGAIGRRLLARLRRGVVVPAPCCECAMASVWAIAGVRVTTGGQPLPTLPVVLAVGWFAVLLTAVDLARRRLPDALTLPAYPVLGAAIGLAVVLGAPVATLVGALVGGVVFGVMHAVVRLLAPRAMGAGDVKLSGSLGMVLGAVGVSALAMAAVLAALITAMLAAIAVLVRSRRWRAGVPHGPGLLAATWLIAMFPSIGSAGSV